VTGGLRRSRPAGRYPPAGIVRPTRPDRLLYVPNEITVGDQVGPRACFEELLNHGRLSGYQAVSVLPLVREHGTRQAWAGVLAAAAELRPTLVLLQHLAGSGLRPEHFRSLRALVPEAVVAYHEADAYGTVRKPLPAEPRSAGRSADVTFVSGTGSLVRNFRRLGARRVEYSAQAYDPVRFGHRWPDPPGRTGGVVMIANDTTGHRRFRGLPGARDRARLVELAARAFGDDFVLHGQGWRVPQAAGPLRYDDQETAYQRGKVAINWDHFPREPGYYSDRLPTCMASATPQVTTWHPLLDRQIPAGNGVFFARRVEEVLDLAAGLLRRPQPELDELGARARRFAAAHLAQDRQYAAMLDRMAALRSAPP
jgi:hypothetical protein